MPMLPLFDVQYKEREGESPATMHQAAPYQPLTQEANLVIVPRPGPTSEEKSIKVLKGVKWEVCRALGGNWRTR